MIIERLPALPAKPRELLPVDSRRFMLQDIVESVVGDIIIERWLPYPASAKRKTIVQRAAGEKAYPKPRNIIIQYEPISARITRQFQRLGITREDPRAYVQRYGASLLDGQILVQQARAAGVVEDIVRLTDCCVYILHFCACLHSRLRMELQRVRLHSRLRQAVLIRAPSFRPTLIDEEARQDRVSELSRIPVAFTRLTLGQVRFPLKATLVRQATKVSMLPMVST